MQIFFFDKYIELHGDQRDREIIAENGEPQTSAAESKFIDNVLAPMGYWEITPDDCGALTSAPLITNGSEVWGFMDYQVTSFLQELAAGKVVKFQKG